jgi:hypothetical protein
MKEATVPRRFTLLALARGCIPRVEVGSLCRRPPSCRGTRSFVDHGKSPSSHRGDVRHTAGGRELERLRPRAVAWIAAR